MWEIFIYFGLRAHQSTYFIYALQRKNTIFASLTPLRVVEKQKIKFLVGFLHRMSVQP